jgi:hypothetical protein
MWICISTGLSTFIEMSTKTSESRDQSSSKLQHVQRLVSYFHKYYFPQKMISTIINLIWTFNYLTIYFWYILGRPTRTIVEFLKLLSTQSWWTLFIERNKIGCTCICYALIYFYLFFYVKEGTWYRKWKNSQALLGRTLFMARTDLKVSSIFFIFLREKNLTPLCCTLFWIASNTNLLVFDLSQQDWSHDCM